MTKIDAVIEMDAIRVDGTALNWKARVTNFDDENEDWFISVRDEQEKVVFEMTLTELAELLTDAERIKKLQLETVRG